MAEITKAAQKFLLETTPVECKPQSNFGSYYIFSVRKPSKEKHLKTLLVEHASQTTDLKTLTETDKFEQFFFTAVGSLSEKIPVVLEMLQNSAVVQAGISQKYKLNPFCGFIRKIEHHDAYNKLEVFFQYPHNKCIIGSNNKEEANNIIFALLVDVLLRIITNNDNLQVITLELNCKHDTTFNTFTCLRTKSELHDKNSSGGGTFTASSLKSSSIHSDDSNRSILKNFLSSNELDQMEMLKRKLDYNANISKLTLQLQDMEFQLQAKERELKFKEEEMRSKNTEVFCWYMICDPHYMKSGSNWTAFGCIYFFFEKKNTVFYGASFNH